MYVIFALIFSKHILINFLFQVQRNSHYPFILLSSTNPWPEVYVTCNFDKVDNSLPACSESSMLMHETANDSDTDDKLDEIQNDSNEVLKKVRFIVIVIICIGVAI
jgi:hypothetical protein